MRLETSNPEHFKEVMGKLNQTEIDNLLLSFKYSEEYVARVKEELAKSKNLTEGQMTIN